MSQHTALVLSVHVKGISVEKFKAVFDGIFSDIYGKDENWTKQFWTPPVFGSWTRVWVRTESRMTLFHHTVTAPTFHNLNDAPHHAINIFFEILSMISTRNKNKYKRNTLSRFYDSISYLMSANLQHPRFPPFTMVRMGHAKSTAILGYLSLVVEKMSQQIFV